MKRLEGIITPMVTPLTPDGRLDAGGVERLTEFLIAGGVAGLFPLGTTGEGPMLSPALQEEMCRTVCRIAAGRIPVLAGISSASPSDSIAFGRAAAEAGADLVVAAPPCYIPLTEDEIVAFYRQVKSEIPLPLYLYNIPSMTKTDLNPSLILRLAEIPGIAGYKDSSGNMNAFHEVLLALKDRPDFSLFVGPDTLMAESVLFGAAGGVNSGSNLFPEVYVNCWKAARSGNLAEMRRWQEKIVRIQKLYRCPRNSSAVAESLKIGLKHRGICGSTMLAPHLFISEAEEQEIFRLVEEIGAM